MRYIEEELPLAEAHSCELLFGYLSVFVDALGDESRMKTDMARK